jgi:hypothetical protein
VKPVVDQVLLDFRLCLVLPEVEHVVHPHRVLGTLPLLAHLGVGVRAVRSPRPEELDHPPLVLVPPAVKLLERFLEEGRAEQVAALLALLVGIAYASSIPLVIGSMQPPVGGAAV